MLLSFVGLLQCRENVFSPIMDKKHKLRHMTAIWLVLRKVQLHQEKNSTNDGVFVNNGDFYFHIECHLSQDYYRPGFYNFEVAYCS